MTWRTDLLGQAGAIYLWKCTTAIAGKWHCVFDNCHSYHGVVFVVMCEQHSVFDVWPGSEEGTIRVAMGHNRWRCVIGTYCCDSPIHGPGYAEHVWTTASARVDKGRNQTLLRGDGSKNGSVWHLSKDNAMRTIAHTTSIETGEHRK